MKRYKENDGNLARFNFIKRTVRYDNEICEINSKMSDRFSFYSESGESNEFHIGGGHFIFVTEKFAKKKGYTDKNGKKVQGTDWPRWITRSVNLTLGRNRGIIS